MSLEELTFPSANGRDTINAWIYTPTRVDGPRAVIQIVHGLGEHSRRYIHMISALLDAGFVVAADDHAGHGRTAMESGVWQDTGEDGARVVVDDERALHDLVAERYPGVPHFLFGHSWGSMIGRGYMADHGDTLTGAMLCGIAAKMRGIEGDVDRGELDRRIAEGHGEEPGQDIANAMFTGATDRYDDVQMPTDWVADDRGVVADHARDPFNNFAAPMSNRFVRDFVDLYDAVNADDWYGRVRDDLPVLILAGDQDPVTGFGEGAYHVANKLVDSGTRDVRTRVWTGHRHEIHNEPESRPEVEAEIIAFVERAIEAD